MAVGQICHDWLARILRQVGGEPRFAHTASEHSTQLALVAEGLGVAVTPDSAAIRSRRVSEWSNLTHRPFGRSQSFGARRQIVTPTCGPRSKLPRTAD